MLVGVANTKGGEGKSLWAASLALFLEAELLDLNPENGDSADWGARSSAQVRVVYPDQVEGVIQEASLAKTLHVADCPPWDGGETRMVLVSAKAVMVPVGTSANSLRGLGRMLGLIAEARKENQGLKVGIVGTGARPVGWTADWTQALKETHAPKNGIHFLGVMPQRQGFIDGYGMGVPGYLAPAPAGKEVTEILVKFVSMLKTK